MSSNVNGRKPQFWVKERILQFLSNYLTCFDVNTSFPHLKFYAETEQGVRSLAGDWRVIVLM